MDNKKLLLQEAFQLWNKLNDAFDSEIYVSSSKRTKKILRVSLRALKRMQRRTNDLHGIIFL